MYQTAKTGLKLADVVDLVSPDSYTMRMVEPCVDHTYRVLNRAMITTALQGDDGTLHEDHGESVTPESVYGRRVTVLVVE